MPPHWAPRSWPGSRSRGCSAGAAPCERRGPGADPDPRAEELRRKLAETGEVAAPAKPEPDVDAARRRVHDEGRAAIEEMERAGEP